MANYSNPRSKSGKTSFSTDSKPKRPHNRAPKPSQGSGRGGSSGPKRTIKKFDPTLFIKKVEETVATPVYIPKNTFSDFAIADQIKKNISDKGYINPTPIQDQAIPVLLEGRDVIATANTGTGKTAAFLIPLLHNVITKKTNRVLIITPTRELANQIRAELVSFAKHTGVHSALCIGGVSINNQIRDLYKNPAFVIGTPGRLIDLYEQGELNFNHYSSIVLDEVDNMLDMGFIKDVKRIIEKLPAKRHSLFFSATIPAVLKETMNEFLRKPVSISVKSRQSSENVNQEVIKVGSKNKLEILHELLIKPECTKTIVFCRTKRAADKLSKQLIERGFKVSTIHGDRSQAQRDNALKLLKNGTVKILLATDVVARGIDIDDVSHVINFDMPESHEDYIHRIGRTGRADKVGQAITLVD